MPPPSSRSDRNEYYLARYAADPGPTAATADEDARFAEDALARGDLEAGLHALAVALSHDPARPDRTALLDRFLAAGGDALAQFIADEDNAPWQAFAGLRAYAAHGRGDHTEAVEHLAELCRQAPESRVPEAWGLGWLTPDAVRAAGPDALFRFIGRLSARYPEPPHATPEQREHLGRAVEVLDAAERAFGPSDFVPLFKCQMLAKAGRFPEAVAAAERAAEERPSFRTATAAAMAHKRAGDVDAAVRWFRRAADLDPDNETSLLDIGDVQTDLGRYRDALAAYEEALGRSPDHHWAVPSAAYCRYKLSGDPDLLDELRRMAAAPPDECGMADIIQQVAGGYTHEDRRRRAEMLVRLEEPGFDPRKPDKRPVELGDPRRERAAAGDDRNVPRRRSRWGRRK